MAKDKKENVEKEVKVVDEVKVEEVVEEKVVEKADLFSHGQLLELTPDLARFEDGTVIKFEGTYSSKKKQLNDMLNYNKNFFNR